MFPAAVSGRCPALARAPREPELLRVRQAQRHGVPEAVAGAQQPIRLAASPCSSTAAAPLNDRRNPLR